MFGLNFCSMMMLYFSVCIRRCFWWTCWSSKSSCVLSMPISVVSMLLPHPSSDHSRCSSCCPALRCWRGTNLRIPSLVVDDVHDDDPTDVLDAIDVDLDDVANDCLMPILKWMVVSWRIDVSSFGTVVKIVDDATCVVQMAWCWSWWCCECHGRWCCVFCGCFCVVFHSIIPMYRCGWWTPTMSLLDFELDDVDGYLSCGGVSMLCSISVDDLQQCSAKLWC